MTSESATRRARAFSADVTASRTARDGFDAFRREWEAQVGEPWPLNGLDAAASKDFKINVQAVSAHDVVIADVYSESYVGRTVPDHETDGWVLLHLMRHGSWRFGAPDGRSEDVSIPAGAFIVRHDGPPALFDLARGSTADVLFLPAPAVAPLPGGRLILGSARSAEARVLMAHAHTVRETVRDLTPTGLRAARDALLELAKGAMRREFDDVEPRLAPALARAAMEIADRRLTDPDLTPAALARQLNVSVRTLHRAFATAGETVAAYIRRRRLEQARLELAAPALRRPGVPEVASRYQFADGSHLARAFKARYGQTPGEFARTPRGEADGGLPVTTSGSGTSRRSPTTAAAAGTGCGGPSMTASTASPSRTRPSPTGSSTASWTRPAAAGPSASAPAWRPPSPPGEMITWYVHARRYAEAKRAGLAPVSRRSVTEALVTVTIALTAKQKGAPEPRVAVGELSDDE